LRDIPEVDCFFHRGRRQALGRAGVPDLISGQFSRRCCPRPHSRWCKRSAYRSVRGMGLLRRKPRHYIPERHPTRLRRTQRATDALWQASSTSFAGKKCQAAACSRLPVGLPRLCALLRIPRLPLYIPQPSASPVNESALKETRKPTNAAGALYARTEANNLAIRTRFPAVFPPTPTRFVQNPTPANFFVRPPSTK